MPTIKKNDIIIRTSTTGHLRVPVGERLLARARIEVVEIPVSYRNRRVGVALFVGRRPLPPMVNNRLLATAYDVFVHTNGAASIHYEAARNHISYKEIQKAL